MNIEKQICTLRHFSNVHNLKANNLVFQILLAIQSFANGIIFSKLAIDRFQYDYIHVSTTRVFKRIPYATE